MIQLLVWWVPQVPMKSFTVPVRTLREARLILGTLAEYDRFQFEENVKPDYCNAGGLSVFDPKDKTDGPKGSWVDWWSEDCDDFGDLTDEQVDALDAQTHD